ncbi:MAG TPA: SRPBCC family protein [Acidimicrobiales bacterium]
MENANAEASIDIDAPPELVYDLIADVTTMPEWAAETHRCRWLGGATEAVVGAKFRGSNRHKGRRWSTTCTVTAAERGRRFAFDVGGLGIRTAEWEYVIEPREGGCRVTESTRRLVPAVFVKVSNWLVGVRDRDAHNRANIERTLAGLKRHAEARAVSR